MPKPTLTCTTPYGTFSRKTFRPYTHVVVLVHPEGHGTAMSWHTSIALALQGVTNTQCEMKRWKPDNSRVVIFETDAVRAAAREVAQ